MVLLYPIGVLDYGYQVETDEHQGNEATTIKEFYI